MAIYTKLRVLMLQLEFDRWRIARSWSYTAQLGLEEGLRAHGLRYFTITTPWLEHAEKIIGRQRFDQVWLHLIDTHMISRNWNEAFCQWVAALAPVRLGLIGESLEYHPHELAIFPHLTQFRDQVTRWLRYVTHVAASDEYDAAAINKSGPAAAIWWPQAVPERFICKHPPAPKSDYAVFSGATYGERTQWLAQPELKAYLVQQPSSEKGTVYPFLFDALHYAVPRHLRRVGVAEKAALGAYLFALRRIRRRCFGRWLKGMQAGCAVINPSSFVKAYTGRIVEAAAAGRPVISWEIPERPLTKTLFEDGKEILLYQKDAPSQLAAHVKRLVSEPEFARQIVQNAQRKVRAFHTMEKRVSQILEWIENNNPPIYQ